MDGPADLVQARVAGRLVQHVMVIIIHLMELVSVLDLAMDMVADLGLIGNLIILVQWECLLILILAINDYSWLHA